MGCDQSKPDKEENPQNRHLPNGNAKSRPHSANNNANNNRETVTNGHIKNGAIKNGAVKTKNRKGPGSAKVAQAPPTPQTPHTPQPLQTPRSDENNKNNTGSGLLISASSFMLRERFGTEKELLLKLICENVIGINATFDGPFGRRKVIYCDFVASGKPVKFIEDYINQNVLPFYANTHTTTSVSALQTSTFREESRDIIKYCINANDEDVVIFTGSGSTSAIHKLINAIQLKGEKAKRTAVIIGPHEHHSNILPWRVSGAKVERVKETLHGELDINDLKEKLHESTVAGLDIIVAMSAGSNVTGILTDTVRITELVHEYGGLCFWDYACAGPYLEVNMNPTPTGYKDAVFVSVHKFLGGTGTPGILMAKKALFTNAVPGGVGGGTVAYVSKKREHYLSNIEEREEGGTPAIVESIRAGLAFQLKQEIGSNVIENIEDDLCRRAFKVWKGSRNMQILGSHTAKRLPIFSILISHPESNKFLHHNFVSILLNDLYGIQARGGCACAGPYAMDLLCMSEEVEQKISTYLVDKDVNGMYKRPLESLKPGFARLNFPYFHDWNTVEFIIKAVDRVASEGWKLLPLYTFDPYSGSWQHRIKGRPVVAHLTDASLIGDSLKVTEGMGLHNAGEVDLKAILREADAIFDEALEACMGLDLDDEDMPLPIEEHDMIWFLLPKAALMHLRTPGLKYFPEMGKDKLPFHARRNTLVRVRNQFIDALDQLGCETDKIRAVPTFYAGDEESENHNTPACIDGSCK